MASRRLYLVALGVGLLLGPIKAQVYEALLVPPDSTTSPPAVDQVFENEIQNTRREVDLLSEKLARQKARLEALQRARRASRGELDEASAQRLHSLEEKVDRLTNVLDKLTQALSNQLPPKPKPQPEPSKPDQKPSRLSLFTWEDSLALLELQQKETAIRRQIGALTLEIIRLTDEVERRKRRLRPSSVMTKGAPTPEPTSPPVLHQVSAAAIDSAAAPLLEKGRSIEEARLEIINHIPDQVLAAYLKSLSPQTRHTLYEQIDEIQVRDNVSYNQARRMAIYFHLYAP